MKNENEKTESRKRRIGRFKINGEFLDSAENNPNTFNRLKQLFGQMIVIDARQARDEQFNLYLDMKQYIAVSELFDEVAKGELIPEYVFIFHAEKEGFETRKVLQSPPKQLTTMEIQSELRLNK